MTARVIAWVGLIGCIALGAAGGAAVERPPLTAGGYTVLAADFHVHSFPGDGGLLPWDLAGEARRRDLDAIALTNHNSLFSWRVAQRFGSSFDGTIVLPGIELTSSGYHIAAIGVREVVPWRQSPVQAAAAIHAQGGLAIAAHPLGPVPSAWDAAALAAVDGFEAASSRDTVAQTAPFIRQAVARRPALAPFGGSDFHYYTPLGVNRTFLFVTGRSRDGMFEAIRSGRTVACDSRGEVFGPPALLAPVAAECRRVATARPSGWHWVDGVSTGGAWISLVALIVLGPRDRSVAL